MFGYALSEFALLPVSPLITAQASISGYCRKETKIRTLKAGKSYNSTAKGERCPNI
jgi:hypothetical protein